VLLDHHASHIAYPVSVVEVHELHALRVATRDADPLYRHPDHHAVLGDQHQLIVGEHLLERHHIARLVGAVQRDDPLPAPLLHAIGVDRRALPHSLLSDHEQGRVALHHHHPLHHIVGAKLDPLHTGGVATHLAHVRFVEADGETVLGGQHDVVAPRGDLNVD